MVTYQDYLKIGDDPTKKLNFINDTIQQHKRSEKYKTAKTAETYDQKRNETIENYQKVLYTVTGQSVPDNISANYKLKSGFFNRFVTQQNQYSLGNGVTWEKSKDVVEAKLGKDFNKRLKSAGRKAIVGGVSFGFFNFDHVEVFALTEFAPLFDEENGSLRAGVRFWQIDSTKPLRATFYEEDGYTEYIWRQGKGEVLQEKRSYQQIVVSSEADGVEIYDGENYPSFPIVPLYANEYKQSELVGIREQIDCHDLIKSGYANNVDEASMIYWTLQNSGGMDDIDLAKFIERMKTIHAADVEEGQATANSVEAPYASREALLTRLRSDLYADYMALDVDKISAGAVTATQIKAAYEAVDDKADEYESCIVEFIQGILELAGIDDNPTFTRSRIVNTQEEIQTVLSAATSLPDDYVTKKILDLLGDGDQVDDVLKQMADDELNRLNDEQTPKRQASMYEITSILGKLKRKDITQKTAIQMMIRIGMTEEEALEVMQAQKDEEEV